MAAYKSKGGGASTTSGENDFTVGEAGGVETQRSLILLAKSRKVTIRLYDGGSSPLGTADLAIGVAGDDWSNLIVETPIAAATIKDRASGAVRIGLNATGIGFFNTTPAAKPTVTGSRGGNAALASFLTGLATLGLVTDSSTA